MVAPPCSEQCALHEPTGGARQDDELQALRDVVIKAAAGLQYHQAECGRHYEAMTKALERLERSVENMTAQLYLGRT